MGKVLSKEDAAILRSLSSLCWSAWLFSMFEQTARSAREWPGTRSTLPYELTPEDASIDFNLRYRKIKRWEVLEDARAACRIDDPSSEEDSCGS